MKRCLASAVLGLIALSLTNPGSGLAAAAYPPHPDSQPQAGVPKGSVQSYRFEASRIFPGTTREYSIYVPAQYDPAQPACVFVGQDGIQNNAPAVFDNLIAKKEMPVTIGLFVRPGVVKAPGPDALDRFNRSFEYDSLSENYARFLLEELFPEVETKTSPDGRPIRLSRSGNDRCIGGASSGAICAFTAAWERPDAFSRVFSAIGTYVGLRGGDSYSTLVRKFEPKPIRVFLQDGSNDLNIYGGDWWMANQTLERALTFAGYEVRHVWGEGGHDGQHAAAIFPDAMRYLWKDWPKPIQPGRSQNAYLNDILLPGEVWVRVEGAFHSADHLAAKENGEVYFNDLPASKTYKIGLDGKVSEVDTPTKETGGLAFGPDGRLCSVAGNDLVVRHDGTIYHTRTGNPASNGEVCLTGRDGRQQVADTTLKSASGITLSPDQTLLYVAEPSSHWVYSYQIQPDGSLAHKQRFFWLHQPDSADDSGAGGLSCDRDGRLYVATRLGLQVCDQPGRVECILPPPSGRASHVAFGGPDFDILYAACGSEIYKRKVKVKGALPFQRPLKPPTPRL